jgi:hypothetical protein
MLSLFMAAQGSSNEVQVTNKLGNFTESSSVWHMMVKKIATGCESLCVQV